MQKTYKKKLYYIYFYGNSCDIDRMRQLTLYSLQLYLMNCNNLQHAEVAKTYKTTFFKQAYSDLTERFN